MLASLTIELRSNLDLLAPGEEVSNWYTCDTCHLSLIKDAHKFLHESQGQERILDTVYRQSPSSKLIPVLKCGNHTMMYILLLLSKKVSRDRI